MPIRNFHRTGPSRPVTTALPERPDVPAMLGLLCAALMAAALLLMRR